MNRPLMLLALLTGTCLAILATANAQVKLSGNTHTEYGIADKTESQFFDTWNDIVGEYRNFRLGVRLSVHDKPAIFAQQYIGRGVERLFAEYRHRGISARIGNFYTLLGRGLVLRTFESRPLRWDSNMLGGKVEIRHALFDAQIIAGKPRISRLDGVEREDRGPVYGEDFTPHYGGELKLKPHSLFTVGGTFVYADSGEVRKNVKQPAPLAAFNRGSIFGTLELDNFSFYGEYARAADVPTLSGAMLDNADALYLSANAFVGPLSLLTEYRRYENFGFFEGSLTNPPTVVREHLSTLMNRKQLQQNANDEVGYFFEANYPVSDNGILTAAYSISENLAGDRIYQDIYGHFELDEFLRGDWLWGLGRQEDFGGRYINWVSSASYGLTDRYSTKVIIEHQHNKIFEDISFTERQYFDQLFTIEFSRSQSWTIATLIEHSTQKVPEGVDRDSFEDEEKFWMGGQLDINLLKRFDLSIFGGSRRKGKICIGGVCVVKPELDGIELTLIGRL